MRNLAILPILLKFVVFVMFLAYYYGYWYGLRGKLNLTVVVAGCGGFQGVVEVVGWQQH